jgi:hypothetical protein
VLLACQAVSSLAPLSQALTQSPPSPTLTASPVPTNTPSPSSTPTPNLAQDYAVNFHPDGPLFIGDQVSIEIISPDEGELSEDSVQIQVAGLPTADLGSAKFDEFGIGKRNQATLSWIWDTSDLEPGFYQLEFNLQPGGESWVETVQLSHSVGVPNPEPQARWKTILNDCCRVHLITGTDAARDLPKLLDILDQQAESASQLMGVDFDQRIPITFLPRVLGHGGFASSEIYISYLDKNYAGNDVAQVLHHEMIHILDKHLGGELRPSLLIEGIAVYHSGGHFKKEPLMPKAAALFELGWYLPLTQLADSFYTSQHEIGYLEGGALVQYMVSRFGWEAFEDFYRDIKPHPSGKQSAALEEALSKHFDLTLTQLEGQFITELNKQHIIPDMYDDLYITVGYYEAVRRYQQALDPSAYFLTAWLPDGEQMRERGIVADYLRRPSSEQNSVIEELLVEVDRLLRAGNYVEAEKVINLVNQELDLIQNDILIGSYQPDYERLIGHEAE